MSASLNACNYCWQCEHFKLNKHLYSNDELTAHNVLFNLNMFQRKNFNHFFSPHSSAANIRVLLSMSLLFGNAHDHIVVYEWWNCAAIRTIHIMHKGKLRMHKISQWSNENCFSFVPEIFLVVSVSRQVCGKMLQKSIDKERERACVLVSERKIEKGKEKKGEQKIECEKEGKREKERERWRKKKWTAAWK